MHPDDKVAAEFNTLRGRICGLIESWGLPDSQERGAISTFKSLTYDAEKSFKALLSEKQCSCGDKETCPNC
jgi:hypothetical protein